MDSKIERNKPANQAVELDDMNDFEKDRILQTPPLSLFDEDHWLISNVEELMYFFSALAEFAPAGSILRIEGNPDPDVETEIHLWLKEPSRKIGMLARTAAKYVVPINQDNMTTLRLLAQNHSAHEVAEHFLVLHNNEQILQWYDAPCDPIYISFKIEEQKVAKFTECLGATMKKEIGSTNA